MKRILALSLGLLLVAASCSSEREVVDKKESENITASSAPPMMAKARADLAAKSGSKVSGTVDLVETSSGLSVNYSLSGLKKNATLGFHFHEKGDCSSKDAKSAGKHYLEVSPTGGTSKDNPQKYAGDLPQIHTDANGKAEGSFTVSNLTVNKENPVEGRAIIVHGGPDDLAKKSPPRIACGVVETVKM